jgi:uncharacterized protein
VTVTLKVADLSSQPRALSAALPMVWCEERMGGLYRAVQPNLQVEVTAARAAEVVTVQVHATGEVGFDCSRCAEPARLPVDAAFTHHFVGPGQLDADGALTAEGAADDDPDVSEHDGVAVNLDDLCIEHAILALPDVPLCSELCRGLCPQCGTNWNQGTCACKQDAAARTPWAALRDVKLQN